MSRYRVTEFAELDSTNRYACSRLRELADGEVIQARVQTAGRGRWNRQWISDVPGNLMISLVLKPVGTPATLPLAGLSQLLALATSRVLERQGVQPSLKWPNDIQVGGKKIAGILAETAVAGSDFLGLVLGIGVNLNLHRETLATIDQPATALNLELGRAMDVTTFRDCLLDEFFSRYDEFLATGFPLIRAEYLKRCPFLGREIELRSPQGSWRGIARNISASGELEFQLPDGTVQPVALGEIVNPAGPTA